MISQQIFSKKAYTYALGFFALLATASSCKEKTVIGTDLVPPIDNINTFGVEDFDINVSNGYKDSLFTSDRNYMLVSLGKIDNDPYFGKTRGGVFMQYALPSFNYTFPEGNYDSVILTIPYYIDNKKSYFYGDTSLTSGLPMKLNAYEITEDWKYDKEKSYFAHDSLATSNVVVGTGTYYPKNFIDTFLLSNGDTVSNALVMKLDNSILDKLKNTPVENRETTGMFVEYFKGLYIAPDPAHVSNWLGLFRLDGGNAYNYGNAQLTLFYKRPGDTTQRTVNLRFDPSISPFFNRIRRDYTNAPVQNDLNNPSTNQVVIQSYPGIYSDITINLDDKVPVSAVNQATLQVIVKGVGMEPYFNPPIQLLVRGLNDDGTEYTIADRLGNNGEESNLGLTFLGGAPQTISLDGEIYVAYKFNLPREVQQRIRDQKRDLKLRIYSSTRHPGFYRMVGYGAEGNGVRNIKFNVVYSLK